MKKKLLILALAVICSLACVFGMSACGDTTPDNGDKPGTVQPNPDEDKDDPKDDPTDDPKDDPTDVAVTSVTLSEHALTLKVSEYRTLTVAVKPDNATDKKVKWSSSDESVAKVEDGKVTALKEGTATITAKAGGKEDTCTVTVNSGYVFAESISLNKEEITLEIGKEETLTVIFNPENATDKSLKWNTTKTDIATVDGTGKVTAKAVGETVVIVDAGALRATCLVKVVDKLVAAESISLSETSITLDIGDGQTLRATVAPEEATDKTVTWVSSDASVAKVEGGKVTALKAGVAVITAKTSNGKTAICTVTVNPPPVQAESVTLDETSLTLEAGQHETLTATVLPDDAANKTVSWVSSDESVATVEDGKVTALKEGTATITAKTANGKTAECSVTVNKATVKVESVTLDETELTLEVGDEQTLTATVLPENAADKEVTWTSSDESVAKVEDGKVTALKVGTATITATADGKSATCAVTVVEPIPRSLDFEEINKDGVVTYTVSGIGNVKATDIVIPAEYNGKPVTEIKTWAFNNKSNLTSVLIPDSVTLIDNYAFNNCSGLTSITIGNNVTTLGIQAFNGCSGITELTIPDSVETIGYYAFSDCSKLTSITIGSKVTEIGARAFSGCRLITELIIPDNVTSIGNYAFSSCDGLTNVTFGNGLKTIGESAFSYSRLENLTIPGNVEIIGKKAFYSSSKLKTVIIGAKEIGESAFERCNIDNLTLSEGVEIIGKSAFSELSFWKPNLTLPDSLKTIGESAFYNYRFNSITIGRNLESIGNSAFARTSPGMSPIHYTGDLAGWVSIDGLQNLGAQEGYRLFIDETEVKGELTIPDDVTSISDYAFYRVGGLTSVTIPGSVETIGGHAFDACKQITAVSLDEGVQTIGEYAFAFCEGLKNITIPDSVTTLGKSSFYWCTKLQTAVIGNGVTEMGENAFGDCKVLTEVTISEGVQTIGKWAFAGCNALTSIIIPDSVTSIGSNIFNYIPTSVRVYYKGTAEQWEQIALPAGANDKINTAKKYYFSADPPALNAEGTAYDGNYWHYDTDEETPVIWVLED